MPAAARFAALAMLGLSACGFEEWPRVGSGPTAYGYSTDAGATPGPFDPGAGAGIGGSSSGSAAPVPGAPSATGAGDRGRAGVDGGGTDAGGGSLQCGSIQCTAGQYCLIETSVNPLMAPLPECRLIPAGCTSCDCMKPFADCLCAPQSGGFVVSCP